MFWCAIVGWFALLLIACLSCLLCCGLVVVLLAGWFVCLGLWFCV